MTTFYSTEVFTLCEDICAEAYGISYERSSECKSCSQKLSEKIEKILFGNKAWTGKLNYQLIVI